MPDMEALEKVVHDPKGRSFITRTFDMYRSAGFTESMSYAKAWRDFEAQGWKPDVSGIWKLNERTLVPYDGNTSKMPLVFDVSALGRVRPDQTPRLLGAITHPDINPTKTFKFEDLVAVQNRVDTKKVTELAALNDKGPVGIVARFAGANHILDGHHRIIGRWLRGDSDVETYFKDLDEVSNAMKSKTEPFTISQEIRKIDDEKRLVFGWASVVEKDGKPVVDHHGDMISVDELVQSAHNFVSASRQAKAMHEGDQVGEFVESMVFTHDIQKALGINLGFVGWWVGMKVKKESVWQDIKAGKFKMFSIGGTAYRIDNGE